jgi:pyruvate-formate lyase
VLTIQTTERIERLRQRMNDGEHLRHRVTAPDDWSVSEIDASVPERRAAALKAVLEMPVAIEPDELIVGMRTIVGPDDETGQRSWTIPSPTYYRGEEWKGFSGGVATHNVPGFNNVIDCGLGGLADRARARLADEADEFKREHLRSFVTALEAVSGFCRRYSDLADQMAADEADPVRRGELLTVAEVCRHVANERPRNLHEAIQLYWFTWLGVVMEVGALVSFGRLDQVLEPFWPTDPAEQGFAQELIDCLVVKCNDQNDLWRTHSLVNNALMLGGLKRDGTDGVNAVTWAVLDSVERLKMPDPQPAVRFHKDGPPELLNESCRMWRDGYSQISAWNDDVFVPAMVGMGFDAADARDYAIDACQDVNIFGKSQFYMAGSISLAGEMLETLNDGTDHATWEDFLADYEGHLAKTTHDRLTGYVREHQKPGDPTPFLSTTLDDCIERGLGGADGGLRFGDKGVFLGEPVCAINSLSAIKHVVYDTKAATLAEVRAACDADFEGCEDLRRKLLDAPKWGNDDDAVDLIGRDVVAFVSREINKYRIDENRRFLAGTHQAHHVMVGNGMPATPDGRHKGNALSPSMAPANGTEQNGPTAVIKSATKLDHSLTQWNFSLTINFDPSGMTGESGLSKFTALIQTFLAMQGPQLQVNCVSADTLRAAQKDPGAYQDLVVRIWGFCDRFVDLLPEYQEELIQRTKHAL